MRTIATMALLAGLAAVPAMAGPIAEAGQSLENSVLNARIQTAYALNDSLDSKTISSEVHDGVVTISGTVSSDIDKDLAGELAKSFDEVERVNNELMVKQPETHDDAAAEERTWAEKIDDATLNADVRRRLAYHSGLDAATLDLDVEGGKVYVSGEVDSPATRDLALRIVRNTEDVTAVKSSIRIDETADTPKDNADVDHAETAANDSDDVSDAINDWWVERRVETAILLDRNVSLWDLDVEVENNAVILTGETISDAQRDLAETIARNTDGVREVENMIRVVSAT